MLTKDLFISYGRRESLSLVGRLHQQLKLAGYEVWFDKVNIPDGEDYAERINHGIETAPNFAYVMAPRSLTSPYCLTELEYARVRLRICSLRLTNRIMKSLENKGKVGSRRCNGVNSRLRRRCLRS
jgi:TIR domain